MSARVAVQTAQEGYSGLVESPERRVGLSAVPSDRQGPLEWVNILPAKTLELTSAHRGTESKDSCTLRYLPIWL